MISAKIDLYGRVGGQVGQFAFADVIVIHRNLRRGCGGRRPRRLRGRDGGGAHGPEDRALHPEPRPDRADVVQPRGRRHRQRTPGARGGRPGRHHGRGDGRGRHPVPPAEHLARAGGVVSARAVRQAAVPAEDARGAGIGAQPPHQAGRGGGADRRGSFKFPVSSFKPNCGASSSWRRATRNSKLET